MPIYEYRCDNCAHEFETIQKVSDAPLKTCPACSQESLRKKISAAGFRLKGGGWYETDFKSDKRKNVAGEKGGEKGGKEASGGSGTGAASSGSSSGGSDSGAGPSGAGKSDSGSKAGGGSTGASKSKASE